MWKIFENYEWEQLKNEFSWIRDMEGVPQDPVFHAEGDVEVHTQMVVKSLLELDEYRQLNEQDKHILCAAALLHDVEKRSVTVVEPDNRVTSKGHAKKGAFTTRAILYAEMGAPFYIREAVVKLVRYHGLPLWVFEKEDAAKAVIATSLEVNTWHLYILAKADVLGRICPDKKDLLYRLDLFKELCHEQDCLGKPKQFPDGLSRFYYFTRKESVPDFVPYDETKFEVTMLSALPGSGKDTYVSQNFTADFPVVSLDNIRRRLNIAPDDTKGNGRVVQEAKEQARGLMRKRQSFIWNATNITRAMREQLIGLFTSYGGKVKIVYLEVPYQTLLKQNSNREYNVPSEILHKMIRKLEVPSLSEAHEVDYVIRE
ncbi:AAA family ATPase [Cytophagaceae bacterium ABcell3]|nr:AAA family ATPase [Cytophagaceae bacterium ABcell3]